MLIEECLVLPTAKDMLGREAMDQFDKAFEAQRKEVLKSMASGPSIV
jgi:hypothetical protein